MGIGKHERRLESRLEVGGREDLGRVGPGGVRGGTWAAADWITDGMDKAGSRPGFQQRIALAVRPLSLVWLAGLLLWQLTVQDYLAPGQNSRFPQLKNDQLGKTTTISDVRKTCH